jgi:hypothetical protein
MPNMHSSGVCTYVYIPWTTSENSEGSLLGLMCTFFVATLKNAEIGVSFLLTIG